MPLNPPPKPHILCVDDEPQVLESLKLNLRRAHTVSTATGGAPHRKLSASTKWQASPAIRPPPSRPWTQLSPGTGPALMR